MFVNGQVLGMLHKIKKWCPIFTRYAASRGIRAAAATAHGHPIFCAQKKIKDSGFVMFSFPFFCTKSDRLATFHQAGMKNVSLLLSLFRSPSLSPVPVPFLLSLLSFCSCPCTSVPLPVPLSLSLPRFGNETIYKTDYRGCEKCSLEMKLQDWVSVAHTNGVRKSLTNEIAVSQVWFWPYEDWQLFTCIKALVYWIKIFTAQKQLQSTLLNKNFLICMLTDTSEYLCHTFMVSTLLRNAYDTSDCYCGL